LASAVELWPGATCLEAGRVVGQVAVWLGRNRVTSDVRVEVRGNDRNARALVFRIVRSGKAHERKFDHLPEGCDDATAVVGLAIALAIDASVLEGVFAPQPPAPRPKRFASIEIATGLEALPGTSVGAAAGIEYGLTEWLGARVDLGTQFSFGSSIQDTAGTFDTAVGYASPQLCAGGDVTDQVRLELCSGAAFGVVHAQGHGYAVSRSGTGPWIEAAGGLRLVATTGFSWVLDVQGFFPVHVPEFRAENAQGGAELRPLSPAGALLSVGPVFFF
jgi:hypothetical protein